MSLSLVAGLGNPGSAYEKTRHNAGFTVIDAFARQHGLAWKTQPQFEAAVARWDKAPGATWLLVKPLTFMNESGRALRRLLDYHKLGPDALIAVYDDLTIELGRVKVSTGGSAGGHNGVASLLQHVGDGFARYRIGIGPKAPPEMDLKDFVLGKFRPEEQTLLDRNLNHYIHGLGLLIDSGPARAMNTLNRRDPHEPDET